MSQKKARLIRVDNFFIQQYFNLFNNQTVISNSKLKNYLNCNLIKKSYFIQNNSALQYNSIFEKVQSLITKNKVKLNSYTYSLYLKNYLNCNSDLMYSNN